MTLRIVGAGLGRTGTHSLKLALERLLGGPCYHMVEVIERHQEHVALWTQAAQGQAVDWERLMEGYVAAVDWPAAAFWQELATTYPDAAVLLSVRDPDAWWRSMSQTILALADRDGHASGEPTTDWPWVLFGARFCERWDDETAAKQAYLEHNQRVRDTVPAPRLVEWRPGDGWESICTALGLPVPDEPFPHVNTTDEFRSFVRLNAS